MRVSVRFLFVLQFAQLHQSREVLCRSSSHNTDIAQRSQIIHTLNGNEQLTLFEVFEIVLHLLLYLADYIT